VVGAELQLEPVTGGLPGREHHPGVVDQQVDRRVPGPQLGGGGADGIQAGQVEGLDRDVRPGVVPAMRAAAALPLSVSRTASTTDAPRAAEDPGGLEPQAGVRAGDHGQPSVRPGTSSLVHFAVMIPPGPLLTMKYDLAGAEANLAHHSATPP